MIALLEGCDATGKTTLANSPVFSGYWKYHHGAYPSPKDAYNAYRNLLRSILEFKAQGSIPNVVIDRMHISERVYGERYHGRWMTDSQYWHIDEMFCDVGGIVIHCHLPWENVVENWKAKLREEMIQDENLLKKIYTAYQDLHGLTEAPIYPYNYLVNENGYFCE
jgi:thymidylate kinase